MTIITRDERISIQYLLVDRGKNPQNPWIHPSQVESVRQLGLPPGFRFRNARRFLIRKCSNDQMKFIKRDRLHCIILNLPRHCTLDEYATALVLLAFHWAVICGELPEFWTADVEHRVSLHGDIKVMQTFHPVNGVSIHSEKTTLRCKFDVMLSNFISSMKAVTSESMNQNSPSLHLRKSDNASESIK